jgi:diaminopimelate epimerase
MRIDFWKMHGAGNDFILVDDRNLSFPASDTKWLAQICKRGRGIGAEGIILLQKSDQQNIDFRMRFFNPDGREAEMCGNGARCAARLAYDTGIATRPVMRIQTIAGIITAKIDGNKISIGMTEPVGWQIGIPLVIDGKELIANFVNTGVPHTVIETQNINSCDVYGIGKAVRFHKHFAPAGTNVNFVKVLSPHELAVRTYERGVEAETPACGTGITASSLIMARLGKVSPPVKVHSAGGDVLEVNFVMKDNEIQNVTLTGPAEYVFCGHIDYQRQTNTNQQGSSL